MFRNKPKFFLRLFVILILLGGLVAGIYSVQKFQLFTNKAATNTVIKINPSRIGKNDPYTLEVTTNSNPYSGSLDYDLTLCDLNFQNCRNASGAWTLNGSDLKSVNGVVTVDGNLNLPEGIYLVRYKPRNSDSSFYSNFDAMIVDSKPMVPPVSYSGNSISLPKPGSYMIFENRDANGAFIGYTRFDVETDPCDAGGDLTIRHTKTRNSAYWNPPWPSQLRWCVSEKWTNYYNTSGQLTWANMLSAHGQTVYSSDANDSLAISPKNDLIAVSYPQSLGQDINNQGLLGAYIKDSITVSHYDKDTDMQAHYALLPLNLRIPSNLSGSPMTIIETAIGHPLSGQDSAIDMWHVEALAPTSPGAAIKMRYVESGYGNRLANAKWNVVEDWDWRLDGLVSHIDQWKLSSARCWTPNYTCTTQVPKTVSADLIEYYIPDDKPLSFKIRNSQTGEESSSYIHIDNGGSYDFIVSQSNGQPYSGFIEFQNVDTSKKSLWTDVNYLPIYVSNGRVRVGPKANGSLKDFRIKWQVRPYLTNSSLNSLYPQRSPISNTSTAAWSNEITFEMGNPQSGGGSTPPLTATPTPGRLSLPTATNTPSPTLTPTSTSTIAIHTATNTPVPSMGDINHDNIANWVDMNLVVQAYNQSSVSCGQYNCDLNHDGRVNILDTAYVIADMN